MVKSSSFFSFRFSGDEIKESKNNQEEKKRAQGLFEQE
jgi:hypothetical protein